MKAGIIYGVSFLFVFVIVTGLIIFFNSTYENIFQFNFSPKFSVQISDSTNTNLNKVDSLKIAENQEQPVQIDSTSIQDSVLFSSMVVDDKKDSVVTNTVVSKPTKKELEKVDTKKIVVQPDTKNQKTELASNQPQNVTQVKDNVEQSKEYAGWVKKVASIYSAMESKKAAKIIQTYSDNVARDILYNMNKKTAAKVVSEFNPETANRIFRFE